MYFLGRCLAFWWAWKFHKFCILYHVWNSIFDLCQILLAYSGNQYQAQQDIIVDIFEFFSDGFLEDVVQCLLGSLVFLQFKENNESIVKVLQKMFSYILRWQLFSRDYWHRLLVNSILNHIFNEMYVDLAYSPVSFKIFFAYPFKRPYYLDA